MARWVLYCVQCGAEFTHSHVKETTSSLVDPFTPKVTKPEFPEGGLSLACPTCRSTSAYQRHQLIYRAN